jgi:hypothetical protein
MYHPYFFVPTSFYLLAPLLNRYLFIFLKFIATVIPTIEYDYTMDVDLGSTS